MTDHRFGPGRRRDDHGRPNFADYESSLDYLDAMAAWRDNRREAVWERMENGQVGGGWRTHDTALTRLQQHYAAADAAAQREPPPSLEQQEADVRAQAAARFAPDPGMERIAAWRDAGDARYDRLDGPTKVSLGYYLHDRQAAAEQAAAEAEARRRRGYGA